MKTIFKILVIIATVICTTSILVAAEITECVPLNEKELQFIKNSKNPKLLTGAALMPACSKNREFLELASSIESPKSLATLSLIELEFDKPWMDSLLKPSVKECILNLIHDDKDNAQSYYLYALLQKEAVGDQEALTQIIKGNEKIFYSYSKQRFNAIVEVAELGKRSGLQARQCAFTSFDVTNTYSKLRQLCRKLIASKGQIARNACFVMGEKLEKGSLTFVEQMVSLGIQNTAIEGDSNASSASMAVKKKVDNIKTLSSRAACISVINVPENGLLHFYEILLNEGEASAQNYLYEFTKLKQPQK